MGRKPQPTQLKVLNGNPGKRPLNAREPEYPVGLMQAPPNLDKVGRDEWLRTGNLLCRQRVLTEADFGVLMTYCWSHQEIMRITTGFKNGTMSMEDVNGKGSAIPSAAMRNLATLQTMHMKAMVELGLTPSSRSRIKAGDEPDEDRMAKLLEG